MNLEAQTNRKDNRAKSLRLGQLSYQFVDQKKGQKQGLQDIMPKYTVIMQARQYTEYMLLAVSYLSLFEKTSLYLSTSLLCEGIVESQPHKIQ